MVHAHIAKIYATKSGLFGYPAEASKLVGKSMGAEFITHKYLPKPYEEGGYYGAMAFPDGSLLLLPTDDKAELICLRIVDKKIEEYKPI